jgi:hypothetical protein
MKQRGLESVLKADICTVIRSKESVCYLFPGGFVAVRTRIEPAAFPG